MIFTTTFEGQRLGGLTAASADGRHTGEPVAPAVAPTASTERKGPTAAVRSVCAIDYRRTPGGVSYIPDWHPSLFSGEEGTRNLAAMLQAFVDLGGMEMGPNVLSIETLREAQRDPERFKHLTVRVFGFTATFVDLTREAQEYLINKLEPAA
jgi:formate C-acetyltransferase